MLIYDVILDVGTTGCQQTVSLYQGDDRSKLFRVTLLQNGKVYAVSSDLNVRLYAVKPDEDEISARCGVRGGSVFWLPAANATDVQGTVRCQMQIRDHSGSVLFTPEFSVEVVGTLPVPELPEGASEDAAYNTEVLSELSASEDGRTLLFRGEPVGAVHVSSELPQSAEEDTIVYLTGEGMFRYTNGMWTRLTDDEMIAVVTLLQQDSHTHENMVVLDNLTESAGELCLNGEPVGFHAVESLPTECAPGKVVMMNDGQVLINTGIYQFPEWKIVSLPFSAYRTALLDAHYHENKSELDKISVSGEDVLYDGKPIGVKVILGNLPNAPAFEGKIVYCAYYSISGFYYSDGTSWIRLTDSSNPSAVRLLLEQKHTHENGSTLDKFTESNGNLLFDGDPIGGVQTVATPNALPANAPDGSVAVALNDGISGTPLAVPAQIADERVNVCVPDASLAIGMPTYSEAAIGAAITAGDIGACGSVSLAENDASIELGLMPVVADLSDNPFASAGITLDPDTVIVAQQCTKKYAVTLDWSHCAPLVAHPDKITEGNGQTTYPISAIYAFEDLTTEEEETVPDGWNVLMATVDTAHGDVTNIEIESGVDINDYIVLPASDENTMTLEGTRAAALFAGVLLRTCVLPAGLYIKRGTWRRLAEAETADA